MRWFWVDRFLSFESGRTATALKNVSLSEEVLDDYQPCFVVMPCSVMIEGLAQTGGVLVAEHFKFEKRVVLAKIASAEFHMPARPGDQLIYRTDLEGLQGDGAMVRGTIHVEDQLVAEVQLMFAFLNEERFIAGDLFEPGDLLSMLRVMGLFDVAVDSDGNPLEVAPRLYENAPPSVMGESA